MFDKIYLKDSNLRPHLEAPLLKERIRFVSSIAERGYCLRYQQMVAEYLLFAVRHLGLKDNDHTPIALVAIWEMGHAFHKARLSSKKRKNLSPDVDTKFKDQMCYTVTWLNGLNMLENIYNDSQNILNRLITESYYKLKHFSAPLLAERVSYLQYLYDSGYCHATIREAAEKQLVVMEMLNLVNFRPVSVSEINTALVRWDSIDRGNHRAHAPKGRRTFRTIAFNWLRHTGMLVAEEAVVFESAKIDDYCQWLFNEKGLADGTISERKVELARMTNHILSNKKSLDAISPVDIDEYLGQRSKNGCSRYTISNIVTCLRDFFHYAYICRWTETDLSRSIHGPRLFSHERLPYAPDWDIVKKLVAYYDGDNGTAIRNHAIMLLLATYGLRTGEIADMRLGDIDWDNDTIVVNHKKRGRSMRYPLSPEAGNAIVRYLQEVRQNECKDRHVFLTMSAPYHGITRCIIYNIVANAYKNTGFSAKHYGGHSLRHACASKLVNSGHSLKCVSDVLGHRSMESTRAYTKLDIANLSVVAEMNWEGLI